MKQLIINLVLIAILACCPLGNCAGEFISAKNNTYIIQPARKFTWDEASKECDNQNMDLLTIENETKAEEIKELLKKVFAGKPIPRFYLGANDKEKFREFYWITSKGRELFTYTNWDRTEPNNYQKLNERCVHIGFYGTEFWNDINCSRKYGFICQERLDFNSLLRSISRA
ncbi:lectin subunit alpha-like [Calliphora vicina]|uniref:lectin subunit alpha-like n=1 Tax=Calliphora vicina TaxID=7373 RepID=UPI00325A5833